MKPMMFRKGQMNLANLGNIALAIIIAIVIIALMATILTEIQEGQPDNSVTRANNQSFTFANNTKQSFTEGRVDTGSVVVYLNVTKVNIGDNYSVTSDGITFMNRSDTDYFDGGVADALNATYSYKIGSSARNITEKGLAGNMSIASFVPTIAIVALAAIIIGMVLVMFGRRKP